MFKSLKMIILGLLVVVMAGNAAAQTEVETTARWTPASYGTPAVEFVVQHSVNDGPWATVGTTTATTFPMTVTFDDSHRVRIAAVDAEGRQSAFSVPSNPYNPSDGAITGPAQPGQPTLF